MKKRVLMINCKKKLSDVVTHFVKELYKELEVYTVDSAMAAYEILLENAIDVFILDVVLNPDIPGDTSGIRLAERIRQFSRYALTPIIFLTSIKDPTMYVMRELNCVGYVNKPYQPEDLRMVLEKALRYGTIPQEAGTIVFRKSGEMFPVRLNEVVYIESLEHVMRVHMCNGEIVGVPYKTHSGILDEANTDSLFQCSRKAVVNKEYVLGIDLSRHCILLRDNRGKIKIGYTYKKRVIEEFIAIK